VGYLVKDQAQAKWLGLAMVGLGSYLIYEAYDKRGRTKPFWTRFVPGM
jgi:hypothetical protein